MGQMAIFALIPSQNLPEKNRRKKIGTCLLLRSECFIDEMPEGISMKLAESALLAANEIFK